jgi:TRAP-type C4-dicarboxylate transport system substrate-binding protein
MRTLLCLLVGVLGATGCTSADRAGGHADVGVRVVTIAQPAGIRPAQIDAWSHKVTALSGGHLKIAFKDRWHYGDVDYESHTVRDVQKGVIDGAWVGARVMDRFGVTDFQPLLVPLLIDSYELEGRVFGAGIPDEMLPGVQNIGLVGVGILPGPMRKMLGIDAPFTGPSTFTGKRIAFQESALTAATFKTLGAIGRAVAGSAGLEGFDGLEQQLSSIYHSQYDRSASFVTGNLNLWPRVLLILMNRNAWSRLGQHDQQTLRHAAQRVESSALDASRTEDHDAMAQLCRLGMSMPAASSDDLSALRAAVQPVYATLQADVRTARWLARTETLKVGLGAPPESAGCAGDTASSSSPTDALDGTWETTLTARDWGRWPPNPGRWHLKFDRGTMTITEPSGVIGYRAGFKAYRGRLETSGETDVLRMSYTLAGDKLTFSDIQIAGDSCTDCSPYSAGLGSRPWHRIGSGR